MKFNLDEIVSKIDMIQKYNSSKYNRQNKRESKLSFKQVLQSKLGEEIDDKYYYNKLNLKDNGIEFGSKEFREYKTNNKNNYFPPVEAPWEVRSAWRNIIENCPNEKRSDLRFLTILLWETIHDKNNHIKTDETYGYNNLCILLINRFKNNVEFKDNPSAEFYLKLLIDFNNSLKNHNGIKTMEIDEYI